MKPGARRVLILEKDVMIGGHSIMSSGYFNAVDPKRQKPLGITDSPALMEKQSLQVGGDTASPILMRRLAESSSEVLEWLEAHGVHWSDQVFESYSSFQRRGHISSPVRAGYDYVMALLECARRLDVKILLGHRAERLITENGHIVGAAGVCRGRQAFEARAHAVILATGGFAANTALLENALGPYAATLRSSANTRGILTDGAAGDGILMARAVGAKIVNMDSVLLVPYNGGRVTGYVGGDIYLTKEGRRFIDEGASWLALRQALQNLPDGKMWVLTDSGTVKNNDFSLKLMTGAVREAATLDEAAKGIAAVLRYWKRPLSSTTTQFALDAMKPLAKRRCLKRSMNRPFITAKNGSTSIQPRAALPLTRRPAFWISPRSPSWVFLRPAKPSEIFTAKAAPAATAFWPASSSAGSPVKKRLNLADQVIERLQVFRSQRQNEFAFVMPDFHLHAAAVQPTNPRADRLPHAHGPFEPRQISAASPKTSGAAHRAPRDIPGTYI